MFLHEAQGRNELLFFLVLRTRRGHVPRSERPLLALLALVHADEQDHAAQDDESQPASAGARATAHPRRCY